MELPLRFAARALTTNDVASRARANPARRRSAQHAATSSDWGASTISSSEVQRRVGAGEPLFLLDVRSPLQFESERLGLGEALSPLVQLRARVSEPPNNLNQKIMAYCKISLRGYEAACSLGSLGYTQVKVMEGGLMAWPFALSRKGALDTGASR